MTGLEPLLKELAPRVTAVLARRFGDFAVCEDAVQEALLDASEQWPERGVPDRPMGWLVTVATRRRVELLRSDTARRRRELAVAALAPDGPGAVPSADDSLTLLMLCCHPSLTRDSQVALTLRAVGGLTTAEIARAFLVPEATIGRRISRAKQRIKAAGAVFGLPPDSERAGRVAAVLNVLYLVFNEGYTAGSGPGLHRAALTAEALRLTRQLHVLLPDDGEVTGLLALMLLTDARRPARTGPGGDLIPLAEQDRTRWDAAAVAEGLGLLAGALVSAPIGPYQVQAAIAAVHDEAARAEDTDWPQILGLYDLLHALAPGPMVTLGRIVAVAMVHGPHEGLARLADAEADPALSGHHRLLSVHAHLLDLTGDRPGAASCYARAARRTLNVPEQRYLISRADVGISDPAATPLV
ncbi:RNA polymerase sigma factor [Actinocorallia longicatena]|uniref:Sigma factor-like helix-turn-helix DNA-binding protein n=1 Tax=Actinocorallia longicatena TaxID=111803 RepID=A0ABP6QNZ0_9ACTN